MQTGNTFLLVIPIIVNTYHTIKQKWLICENYNDVAQLLT